MTLHLTLNKKWFDMIDQGIKTEEYREIKDYWRNRLLDVPFTEGIKKLYTKHFEVVEFSNGYLPTSRKMIVECKGIDIGKAVTEWSDNGQGDVFRIHLGEVLQRINF